MKRRAGGARGRGDPDGRSVRARGRTDRRARRREDRTPERPTRPLSLGPVNFALLAAALAAILVGYILLDRGSITAAPLLLVLGYAVLIPAGLLVGSRRRPDA